MREHDLLEALTHEAPPFLRTLLDLNLPPVMGRLRLPVVETEHKRELAAENSSAPQFFTEVCELVEGARISKGGVYDAYESWCRDNQRAALDKIEFGRQFRPLVAGKAQAAKVEVRGKRTDGYTGLRLREYTLAA